MLDLSSLQAGDEIHHPFLVLDVVARGGDHPRTVLTFGNRTGRIESAPFWAGKDEMVRGLAKGMIVQVVGAVSSYRESLQLDATSVRPLPKGSVPLADLAPSVGPVEAYWQFLDDVRTKLTAPRLRATVDLLFADSGFRERFEQCPGAPGQGHHAAIGGLLQHTCEVVLIARQMARVAKADAELVMVAAMLHDIGKVECYTWETGVFDTNAHGRLIGHIVLGAMMLRERIAAPTPPPARPRGSSSANPSSFPTTASSRTAPRSGRSPSRPRSCTTPTTRVPRPPRSPRPTLPPSSSPATRACPPARCGSSMAGGWCAWPRTSGVRRMPGTTKRPISRADRPLPIPPADARGIAPGCSATSRSGSRTTRSYGPPRHQIGEDEARETLHHLQPS